MGFAKTLVASSANHATGLHDYGTYQRIRIRPTRSGPRKLDGLRHEALIGGTLHATSNARRSVTHHGRNRLDTMQAGGIVCHRMSFRCQAGPARHTAHTRIRAGKRT
jgi:hypothetical protein